MAKKRKKSVAKKSRRRRVTLLGNKTMNAVINGAVIGGSAVGSTWLVNLIPVVKDQTSWIKALVQTGLGIAGLTFSKDLMVKKAFSGVIAGAVISIIIPFMPEGFRFGTLTGGRAFSNGELSQLKTMGTMPAAAKAGKPVTIGRPVGIGLGSRGSRAYSKAY